MTSQTTCASPRLTPKTKKSIARDALGGMPITDVADKHQVCRNSVYKQQAKANEAINDDL